MNPHTTLNDHAVRIENDLYVVDLSASTGAILRIYDRAGGLELITEPSLADNFRICMALPGFEAKYIHGKEQHLTSFDQEKGGITLVWDGPLKDLQGTPYDSLSATMRVELVDERVEFRLDVRNRTPHRMYEVWYPIIGGMNGIGERKDTKTYIPGPDNQDLNQQLFWNFQTKQGVLLAMTYPDHFFKHPEHLGMLWMDIYNPRLRRGIYFGHHDRSALPKVLRAELQPGVGSLRAPGTSWPRPEEVDPRFPVGLNIEWLYLADDLEPGVTFHGAPVVLQSHEGAWEQAASIHRALGGPVEPPREGRNPTSVVEKAIAAGISEVKKDNVRLENALYLVEVDPESGVIRRIFDKVGEVELITEPRIANSFQLLTLTAGMQRDAISGKDQLLSSIETQGDSLRLSWNGPLKSEAQAWYEISVEMAITFVESQIEFRLHVDNRTTRTISEVWYPIVGGISGIGDPAETRSTLYDFENSFEWYLASAVDPSDANTGVVSEIKRAYAFEDWKTPDTRGPGNETGMPRVNMYNVKTRRALYFASHDTCCRAQAFRFEKRPGIADDGGPDYSSPIGFMHWIYYPYARPNETFDGPPVVFRFHDGDWHNGARIYAEWFRTHFKIRDPREDWIRQEMAYQSSMFLSPEAEKIHWRFADIPRWAKGAKDHGVNTVHIAGWMEGGHYADQPSYRPDPRLGTWEELAEAIRECHAMGIKVIFFVNTYPLCMDLEWYDQELYKYRAISEHGEWRREQCAGCGTVSGRMITARALPWKQGRVRMTIDGSIGIPEFRELLVRQYMKLAEIGADGLHVDQFTGWGFDFNPLLELPPDRAVAEGQLRCMEETLQACREINPEFSVSIESHDWDRPLEYGNVAWNWIPNNSRDWKLSNIMKYTFPEWVDSCTVYQPYDYNVVNNAVRYGFFLHIAFGNWTSYMGDELYKPLSNYIKEIQRLRGDLKDTIYMGEYLDNLEADVEVPEDMRYGVHRNTESGKRAVVAINFDTEPHDLSVMSFEGNTGGSVYIYEPFKERVEGRLPLSLVVPGERLAIVVEK